MRDFKGMKRQRNRNRNGGGGGGGNGGGKPQHNANRAFDSNGPEGVKVRGAAQHVYEKYQQLARDAGTSGDRVLAENYLQHAEHYFRLMRAMQPQRPLSEIIGRDQFVSGYDIDFEDEPSSENEGEGDAAEPAEALEVRGERRDDGRRDEARRDDGYRQDNGVREPSFRQDRPERDRPYAERNDRAERPFVERPQNDRFNQERRRDRDDRPRFPREDRPARPERLESDPLPMVEPEATPLVLGGSDPAPILRADDGEVSHAPAFLQPRAPRAEGEEPRRRRRRRSEPRDDAGDEAPPEATESPAED